jgi:hypothetical protein
MRIELREGRILFGVVALAAMPSRSSGAGALRASRMPYQGFDPQSFS